MLATECNVTAVYRSVKSMSTVRSLVRLNMLGNSVCHQPQFVHKVSIHSFAHSFVQVVC